MQMILMQYHASFVIFEKAAEFRYCHLLQIIGGSLMFNLVLYFQVSAGPCLLCLFSSVSTTT